MPVVDELGQRGDDGVAESVVDETAAQRREIGGPQAHVEHAADGVVDQVRFARQSAVWRSSIAAEAIAPNGLARSWPAMSGAEPCTGS